MRHRIWHFLTRLFKFRSQLHFHFFRFKRGHSLDGFNSVIRFMKLSTMLLFCILGNLPIIKKRRNFLAKNKTHASILFYLVLKKYYELLSSLGCLKAEHSIHLSWCFLILIYFHSPMLQLLTSLTTQPYQMHRANAAVGNQMPCDVPNWISGWFSFNERWIKWWQ